MTIYLYGKGNLQGPATKKKPPFCNARALITPKLCAVGMRNAILGNDLKLYFESGVRIMRNVMHLVLVSFDNPMDHLVIKKYRNDVFTSNILVCKSISEPKAGNLPMTDE